MLFEDIDRIAQEYFDDKESTHEMDEIFMLAKKGLLLNQLFAHVKQLRSDYEKLNNPWGDRWDYTNPYDKVLKFFDDIEKDAMYAVVNDALSNTAISEKVVKTMVQEYLEYEEKMHEDLIKRKITMG